MAVIGGDTETIDGEPLSIQFYSEELDLNYISLVEPKSVFRSFLAFLSSLKADGSTYTIYCHNLSFDMVSLFYSKQEELLRGKFEFKHGSWFVRGLYGPVCYAHFSHSSGKRTVYLIDTGKFLMGSLSNLAATYCPNLPKLDAPRGLGKKRFDLSNKKFVRYAMRDAEICYQLGLQIAALHEFHDVRPSVSAPQLASRVFRHKFLTREIKQTPRKVMYAALHSYHGGKNNLVKTGYHEGATFLDIISAYPHAMASLPSFSDPGLLKAGRGSGAIEYPPFGVFQVSGKAKPCPWPVLYSHDFKPIIGDFRKVWTTGFELNEAVRTGEAEFAEVFGYYYDAEKDREPSPFKAYVEHFFAEKEKAKNPIDRYFNKILLNSLYGKFIQKHHITSELKMVYDVDEGRLFEPEKGTFVAGGLFNPFIASLITGHTRAAIHRLEHRFKAIHTSTDGIITTAAIPARLPVGLGGLKIEFKGSVLILRNKLYVGYSEDGKGPPSILFPGLRVGKYALHGFHSSVEELERMIQAGRKGYSHVRVNKLKESHRRNLQVNRFEERSATLNLDFPNLGG